MISSSQGSGSWWYIFILVLAQIMVGSGGSPLYTLGTTYIDDHVSPKKAPVYIGETSVKNILTINLLGLLVSFPYLMKNEVMLYPSDL